MKNPMENCSIGAKLGLGFGFVLLITLIVAITSLLGINSLLDRAEKVHLSERLDNSVIALSEQRQLYLKVGTEEAYEKTLVLEAILREALLDANQRYDSPTSQRLVREATNSLEEYKTIFARFYRTQQEWNQTVQKINTKRKHIYQEVDHLLERLRNAGEIEAMVTTLYMSKNVHQSADIISEYVRKNRAVPITVIQEHIPNIASDLKRLSLRGPAQLSQHAVLQLFDEYSQLLMRTPELKRETEENSDMMLRLSETMSAKMIELGRHQQQVSQHLWDKVRTTLVIVTLLAILIGGFFAWSIQRMIVIPLKELMGAIDTISQGDLSQTFQTHRCDELGKLYNKMGNMSVSLNNLISQVTNSVSHLSTTSQQLTSIANNNQAMMKAQRDKTDQVATAINQMSSTVAEVARNADTAAIATNRTDDLVNQGYLLVQSTVAQITNLATELNTTQDTMASLKHCSDNVGSILEVITAVAERTNLLALNAAIEASKAGEFGRGFAVVAEEVRDLAFRTRASTLEIEQLVDELQSGAQTSLEQIQTSRGQSIKNADQAKTVLKLFENITEQMSQVQDMNQQIATAAEQQALVANEINCKVKTVRHLADQTTTANRESVIEADNLKGLSHTLTALTECFITRQPN